MPLRIAYIFGGVPDPKDAFLVETGQAPSFEYHQLLKRFDADIISFDNIHTSRGMWTRIWRKKRRHMFALASVAHEQALKYDAIICSGEDIGIPIALGALVDGLTIPIFIITHGSYLNSRKFFAVALPLRAMKTVHFLCLSESIRQDLIRRHHFSPKRTHNTGYGIDTNFFTPTDMPHEPLIVSAGVANRDYKTLVRACDGIGYPLRIAADSKWYPADVDVEGDELPSNVRMGSCGGYPALRDLYASATVVTVPLHQAKHACGYAVIAEAMAMGKPVIATKTDACSDFIIDGQTGYYVEPGDVEGLRSKIRMLLSSDAQTTAIGIAARKRMEEQFGLEAYCNRIEGVIRKNTER